MSNVDDNHRSSPGDDLEFTAEEAAEAQALAEALAGRSVHLDAEVLEGVGLMRLAHRELSAASAARIEGDLLERRGVRPALEQQRRAWWWIAIAALAPAAVIALVLSQATMDSNEELVSSGTSLPIPEIAVLQAQASWLNSDSERSEFEREMHGYRELVLASLDGR